MFGSGAHRYENEPWSRKSQLSPYFVMLSSSTTRGCIAQIANGLVLHAKSVESS